MFDLASKRYIADLWAEYRRLFLLVILLFLSPLTRFSNGADVTPPGRPAGAGRIEPP